MTITPVSLSKRALGAALVTLADREQPAARQLYRRLATCWDPWNSSLERAYVTARLTDDELDLFQRLSLPGVVQCRYRATYSDPDSDTEVTVYTADRPRKRRTLRTPRGRVRLVRTSLSRLTPTEQESIMARKTASTKTKPADDELDGLEDLDDLDDTDEDEDDETDDEDEDTDEEEAPAPKSRRSRRAAAEKPASKNGGSKKKGTPPPTRALPDGKFGASEIAEMAGCTGRDVRVYLRKKEIPVNAELGRYAFTKAQAEKIAKAIKTARAK